MPLQCVPSTRLGAFSGEAEIQSLEENVPEQRTGALRRFNEAVKRATACLVRPALLMALMAFAPQAFAEGARPEKPDQAAKTTPARQKPTAGDKARGTGDNRWVPPRWEIKGDVIWVFRPGHWERD